MAGLSHLSNSAAHPTGKSSGDALFRLASDDTSSERLGGKIQRIYALSRSSVGKRLLAEHGLELLDSINTIALRAASPEHAQQLDAVDASKAWACIAPESCTSMMRHIHHGARKCFSTKIRLRTGYSANVG